MKRKKSKKTGINWFYVTITLILLVIVGLLFLILTDKINLDFSNNRFNPFGDFGATVSEYSDIMRCSDANIGNEYLDLLGAGNIETAKESCEASGGIYRSDRDISGCSFDTSVFSVDCNNVGLTVLEKFCEDNLKAEWVCSNSIGFVGCVCDREAEGIDCEWVEIDRLDTTLNPSSTYLWGDELPMGKYYFDWSFTTALNVDIIEDPAGEDNMWTYDGSKVGNHYFQEDEPSDEWLIQIENPTRSGITVSVTLNQWVCEGDPLNWQPDLFDAPKWQSGQDEEPQECYDSDGFMDLYNQYLAVGYCADATGTYDDYCFVGTDSYYHYEYTCVANDCMKTMVLCPDVIGTGSTCNQPLTACTLPI